MVEKAEVYREERHIDVFKHVWSPREAWLAGTLVRKRREDTNLYDSCPLKTQFLGGDVPETRPMSQ